MTQTGNITTTFIDAHGEVRFTGACSEYVSKLSVQKTATTNVWAISFPNFILQTVNNQECDIYGPLCQTGSITVGVDLTTATTTTTVDCSYYLSAESYSNRYLKTAIAFQKGIAPPYLQNFGRESECRSWASLSSANPATYSYSSCNNASSTLAKWQDYQPMGLNMLNNPAEYYAWFSCCGTCQFYANAMRLVYFPPANLTCFTAGNGTSGADNSTTTPKIEPVVGSTAVYNGMTLTSPSVYVEIIGTAGISDSCGPVMPVVTNPIVAVDLTDLSTLYIHPVTDGQTYYSQLRSYQSPGITKGFRQLTLSDLACPTFGLSDPEFDSIITSVRASFVNEETRISYTAYSSHYAYHFGPPYNPVVLPPKQLLSYHSSWLASCGTIGDGIERMLPSWGVIDPPVYLTAQKPLQPSSQPLPADPQTTLGPPSHTTVFNPSTVPSTVLPGSPTPPQPVKTSGPPASGGGGNNNGGPGQDPPGNGGGNNDPGSGGNSGGNGGGNGDGNSDPGSPGGSNNGGGGNGGGTGGGDGGGSGGSGGGGYQDGGGFIATGIGNEATPTTVALPAPQPGSQTVITVGGQPVTVPAASTAIIGGFTVHAGDPGATVGGSVYSIDNSGSMIVSPTGGAVPFTTIPLSMPTSADAITVTQGGRNVVIASGRVVAVDGITAAAGESAVTVSGTVFSVDPTGGLVVATAGNIVPGSGSSLKTQYRSVVLWYAVAFVALLWIP